MIKSDALAWIWTNYFSDWLIWIYEDTERESCILRGQKSSYWIGYLWFYTTMFWSFGVMTFARGTHVNRVVLVTTKDMLVLCTSRTCNLVCIIHSHSNRQTHIPMCTWHNLIWLDLYANCGRSVIFSGYFGFATISKIERHDII